MTAASSASRLSSAHIPLVVSTRGGIVENIHHGSIAVVDRNGRILFSAGDPDTVSFSRSALKAFQALPFLRADGPRQLGLTRPEVALLTASHSGESFHVEAVQAILDKAGMPVQALQCGCHAPYFLEATGQAPPADLKVDARHHNCSGKHAGFLSYCRLQDLPTQSYLDLGHPLQQRIRSEISGLLGMPPQALPVGIDGCSAPNLAMPLSALARLWAMLAGGGAGAATDALFEQLFDAMTAHPDYVSGTARNDLDFAHAGQGDWVAKAGADGVQTLAVRSRGLGIAIKIGDGHANARSVAMVEVLRQLGLGDPTHPDLARHAKIPITNIAGLQTGELKPVFELIRH
jgi:L-asparaginase II